MPSSLSKLPLLPLLLSARGRRAALLRAEELNPRAPAAAGGPGSPLEAAEGRAGAVAASILGKAALVKRATGGLSGRCRRRERKLQECRGGRSCGASLSGGADASDSHVSQRRGAAAAMTVARRLPQLDRQAASLLTGRCGSVGAWAVWADFVSHPPVSWAPKSDAPPHGPHSAVDACRSSAGAHDLQSGHVGGMLLGGCTCTRWTMARHESVWDCTRKRTVVGRRGMVERACTPPADGSALKLEHCLAHCACSPLCLHLDLQGRPWATSRPTLRCTPGPAACAHALRPPPRPPPGCGPPPHSRSLMRWLVRSKAVLAEMVGSCSLNRLPARASYMALSSSSYLPGQQRGKRARGEWWCTPAAALRSCMLSPGAGGRGGGGAAPSCAHRISKPHTPLCCWMAWTNAYVAAPLALERRPAVAWRRRGG